MPWSYCWAPQKERDPAAALVPSAFPIVETVLPRHAALLVCLKCYGRLHNRAYLNTGVEMAEGIPPACGATELQLQIQMQIFRCLYVSKTIDDSESFWRLSSSCAETAET